MADAPVASEHRSTHGGSEQRAEASRRLLDDRERFVAFAFAGADLLLESTADGRTTFAAGAFRSRLGRDPAAMIGKQASSVVAAEDGPAFAACLALLTSRGRIAPIPLRLADARRSPCVVSGLARPGPDGAPLLCWSFGQPCNASPVPAALSAAAFGREAEGRLRAAGGDHGPARPTLDLVEVVASGPALPEAEVAAVLLDYAGAGTVAGEFAGGRFGLLRAPGAADTPALAEVVAGLQNALDARGVTAKVASVERLPLGGEDGEQPGLQAVRALRYALSTFSRGGAPALAAAGFSGGLSGFVTSASARTAALRRALAERRFRLAFQPIVDLESRAVHHYEALVRPDPSRDLPVNNPGDFVALAEMVGLAEDLDWAVFEAARGAAARSGVAVAFNLSGLSAQSPAFRKRLLATLDRPLPGGAPRVLAEVTETAEIEDEAAAAETIAAVRERGMAVCIDDFGAGTAAFRYLRRFQVDHVKIDGAYVRQAPASDRDRGFVKAMVDLSSTVRAHATAEQIETDAVADLMRSLGVRYGQGWLFGRAGELPAPRTAAHRRRGAAAERWE